MGMCNRPSPLGKVARSAGRGAPKALWEKPLPPLSGAPSPKGRAYREGHCPSLGKPQEITYPADRRCRAVRRNQRNTVRFDPVGSKLNCSAVSPLPTKAFAFAGAPELLCPYLSSRQAMPGSSKPSRNSRDAPPPVEMWVILSAKPSCSQAAAESPPPTMVTASESARA